MNCPECEGPSLYNWVIRHTNTCTIRDAEDATQNADRERLDQNYRRGFTRSITNAERTLLLAAGHTPSDEAQTLVTWNVYRHRSIDAHPAP